MLIDVLVNILIRLNNRILFTRRVILNIINTYLIISSLRLMLRPQLVTAGIYPTEQSVGYSTDTCMLDGLAGEHCSTRQWASSTCSTASRASRARHARQRAERARRISFSIQISQNTTPLWIVFNSSIKLSPIIDTSCKPLLPSDCLHCLKTPTDLSNSTNLP